MKDNQLAEITAEDKILQAHEYLKRFLDKFETAQRGGIHDFMELNIANMIGQAIANIDTYLSTGHKRVVANEIMEITIASFQTVLDNLKRNLEGMKTIGFER
jgi:hypothetical protein